MNFKKIDSILRDNGFFGSTIKREENERLIYKYRSIRYYSIEVSVIVARVDKNTFGYDKMVLSISFNDRDINEYKDFITAMKGLHVLHNKERIKLYRKV
jgi:hypothetical protein